MTARAEVDGKQLEYKDGEWKGTKVSVILTCWKRFDNFARIMKAWLDQPETDEIIVWDNSGGRVAPSPLENVIVINSSHNFGSSARYALGALVKNACVMFGDDDIIPKPGFLAEWLPHFKRNRILGVTGRNYVDGTYDSGYNNVTLGTEAEELKVVDFVVGYLMMMHRDKLIGFNYRDAAWYCCELELMGKLRFCDPALEICVPPNDLWEKLPEGDDENALCLQSDAEAEKHAVWDKWFSDLKK